VAGMYASTLKLANDEFRTVDGFVSKLELSKV
jgi:hypothetical protein